MGAIIPNRLISIDVDEFEFAKQRLVPFLQKGYQLCFGGNSWFRDPAYKYSINLELYYAYSYMVHSALAHLRDSSRELNDRLLHLRDTDEPLNKVRAHIHDYFSRSIRYKEPSQTNGRRTRVMEKPWEKSGYLTLLKADSVVQAKTVPEFIDALIIEIRRKLKSDVLEYSRTDIDRTAYKGGTLGAFVNMDQVTHTIDAALYSRDGESEEKESVFKTLSNIDDKLLCAYLAHYFNQHCITFINDHFNDLLMSVAGFEDCKHFTADGVITKVNQSRVDYISEFLYAQLSDKPITTPLQPLGVAAAYTHTRLSIKKSANEIYQRAPVSKFNVIDVSLGASFLEIYDENTKEKFVRKACVTTILDKIRNKKALLRHESTWLIYFLNYYKTHDGEIDRRKLFMANHDELMLLACSDIRLAELVFTEEQCVQHFIVSENVGFDISVLRERYSYHSPLKAILKSHLVEFEHVIKFSPELIRAKLMKRKKLSKNEKHRLNCGLALLSDDALRGLFQNKKTRSELTEENIVQFSWRDAIVAEKRLKQSRLMHLVSWLIRKFYPKYYISCEDAVTLLKKHPELWETIWKKRKFYSWHRNYRAELKKENLFYLLHDNKDVNSVNVILREVACDHRLQKKLSRLNDQQRESLYHHLFEMELDNNLYLQAVSLLGFGGVADVAYELETENLSLATLAESIITWYDKKNSGDSGAEIPPAYEKLQSETDFFNTFLGLHPISPMKSFPSADQYLQIFLYNIKDSNPFIAHAMMENATLDYLIDNLSGENMSKLYFSVSNHQKYSEKMKTRIAELACERSYIRERLTTGGPLLNIIQNVIEANPLMLRKIYLEDPGFLANERFAENPEMRQRMLNITDSNEKAKLLIAAFNRNDLSMIGEFAELAFRDCLSAKLLDTDLLHSLVFAYAGWLIETKNIHSEEVTLLKNHLKSQLNEGQLRFIIKRLYHSANPEQISFLFVCSQHFAQQTKERFWRKLQVTMAMFPLHYILENMSSSDLALYFSNNSHQKDLLTLVQSVLANPTVHIRVQLQAEVQSKMIAEVIRLKPSGKLLRRLYREDPFILPDILKVENGLNILMNTRNQKRLQTMRTIATIFGQGEILHRLNNPKSGNNNLQTERDVPAEEGVSQDKPEAQHRIVC